MPLALPNTDPEQSRRRYATRHDPQDSVGCSSKALFIIDGDLQIRFSNSDGAALARESLVSSKRFVASDRKFAALLQHWLRRCHAGTTDDETRLPLAMRNGRQVAVDAVHLGGLGIDLVVLTVDDPYRMIARNLSGVGRAFGLTATETRMLAVIVEGLDTVLAAKRLGIAPTTARTHLQNVFAKTGTARQSELVHFVATYVQQV